MAKKTRKSSGPKGAKSKAGAARRREAASGVKKAARRPAAENERKPERTQRSAGQEKPTTVADRPNQASGKTKRITTRAAAGQSGRGQSRRRTTAADEDLSLMQPEKLRKTNLTEDQLAQFKELLLTKRRELTGTVNQLREDALHKSRQDAAGDLSSMPIHMADLGSDNWEQEFTLGLLANENELLREIDEALQRIVDGTYGICLATNKPIQKARLRAKPWAKYCIEYAREMELRRRYRPGS